MGLQLFRHDIGHPNNGGFDEIVVEVSAIALQQAQTQSIANLNNKSLPACEHQRGSVAAGDDMGVNGTFQNDQSRFHIVFPERLPPRFASSSPYIVDQDVELSALLFFHLFKKSLHLCGDTMVYLSRKEVYGYNGEDSKTQWSCTSLPVLRGLLSRGLPLSCDDVSFCPA